MQPGIKRIENYKRLQKRRSNYFPYWNRNKEEG
jgi:hypothetical protein